jgi:6-pyruvoyl-tetrahydropterin synthase
MWVVAEFEGEVNEHGILLGLEFGRLKSEFRNHLDTSYDHHLLLNKNDPIASYPVEVRRPDPHPGAVFFDGDPTTENIARWIGEWCVLHLVPTECTRIKVEVWETQVNGAIWELIVNG